MHGSTRVGEVMKHVGVCTEAIGGARLLRLETRHGLREHVTQTSMSEVIDIRA
jgi:hypothetical protein